MTNHGIDLVLIEKVFRESKKLFALPDAEKEKLLQDENNRGYTPFEEEILDPILQKKGDTKEGFYIGLEIPLEDPRSQKPLHGPNQWPGKDLLPDFRPIMESYFQQVHSLSLRLVRLISLALDLPENFFELPGMFDCPMALLRLIHYSTELSFPEEGIFGSGAHTDYGMLTLLAVDGPGLQICKDKDKVPQVWEGVDGLEGAFVVNLGDMLERWSNNLFRSTMHRVCCTNGRERYSVPFFFEPNFDCVVECLPTCHDEKNPPKWPPTTSGQYLLDKYNSTHTGFHSVP